MHPGDGIHAHPLRPVVKRSVNGDVRQRDGLGHFAVVRQGGAGQGRQEQQGGAEALCGSHGDQPAECLRARNSSFLTLIYPNPCSIPRCRTPCGNGPSNPHARLKVRDQISDDQALRQANRRLDRLTINPLRNTTSGRNRLRYGLCVGTKALLNGSGGVSAGGRELKGWKGAAVVTAGNL